MKQTEEQLLQNITRLFADLEDATYGKERANGRFVPPDARNFYYCSKCIYDATDELVESYQPNYISKSDYNFIYDSKRTLLLDLAVLKEKNKLEGDQLTWELERYLSKFQGLFDCILSHYKK